MRWTAGDRGNIEDDAGQFGGRRVGMIPLGIGGFIVVALLSMFTGVDFFSMLGGGGGVAGADRGRDHGRQGHRVAG